MNISFSICSNNYLAQALTLFYSYKKLMPNDKNILILMDKKNSKISYCDFKGVDLLIEIKDIEPEIEQLSLKYDIVEISTAVKPKVFLWLFETFKDADTIHYLDPDLFFYQKLPSLFQNKRFCISLTPHILQPVEFDNLKPNDNTFLKFGVYNLGFISISRDIRSFKFLNWWKAHTYNAGYNRPSDGQFVDQLPLNLSTIFFDFIYVNLNPAFNVAPWNAHERDIKLDYGTLTANSQPLIFYHFSNYSPIHQDRITKYGYYTRVDFDSHRILKIMYDDYQKLLLSNQYMHFSEEVPFYGKKNKKSSMLVRLFFKLKRKVFRLIIN
jgi:hypothetical protein